MSFSAERVSVCRNHLSGASTRSAFYVVLQDLLANVVGAEHFTFLEPASGSGWRVTASCGAQALEADSQGFANEEFDRALRSMRIVESVTDRSPVAVVPFKRSESVVAMLVIHEWLPQNKFSAAIGGRAVLEMFANEAGQWLCELTGAEE